MIPYTVEKPARVCAASGRELIVGERIHSALVEAGGRFSRKDFAPEAWAEPAGTVAHWQTRLPAADAKAKPIDDELLFECFDHLNDGAEPRQRNLRHVLALLLMRRKRLVFVDSRKADAGETMVLKDRKRGTSYEVADPQMTDADLAAAQDELVRLLEGA